MKTPPFTLNLLWTVVILLFCPFVLLSQNEGLPSLHEDESFFFSGLSPSILAPGRIEVNYNSSLLSFWHAIHQSVIESPVRDRLRETQFAANLEAYYGFSGSGRWDVGGRLRYARRRMDNRAQNSPLEIFRKSDRETSIDGLDMNHSGIKEVGLRLRVMPFERVPQFTLNGGYSFVPNQQKTVETHLPADRSSFDLNIAYYITLNENASSFYYFILSGTAFLPGNLEGNEDGLYNSSGSFFVVQRLGKWMLYPGLSYILTFKPPAVADNILVKSNEQVLGTLGLQYNPGPGMGINVSTAYPFLLETMNNLQQHVRESYSFVSVGGRFLF